jgi:hypothetical protein
MNRGAGAGGRINITSPSGPQNMRERHVPYQAVPENVLMRPLVRSKN